MSLAVRRWLPNQKDKSEGNLGKRRKLVNMVFCPLPPTGKDSGRS
jgi:hypothetical protein